MNKRRLLKLADLLEADAKNKKGIKFSLTGWGSTLGLEKVSHSCGTTACAVGLAVVSGAFSRSGLRNELTYSVRPSFEGKNSWDAVMAFWDLKIAEADFLFRDKSYKREHRKGAVGERYVAKRIRDFVAGKVAP